MNKATAAITTAITITMAAVNKKATAAISTATVAAVSNKATAAKTRAGTTQRTKKSISTVTVSLIVGSTEIG